MGGWQQKAKILVEYPFQGGCCLPLTIMAIFTTHNPTMTSVWNILFAFVRRFSMFNILLLALRFSFASSYTFHKFLFLWSTLSRFFCLPFFYLLKTRQESKIILVPQCWFPDFNWTIESALWQNHTENVQVYKWGRLQWENRENLWRGWKWKLRENSWKFLSKISMLLWNYLKSCYNIKWRKCLNISLPRSSINLRQVQHKSPYRAKLKSLTFWRRNNLNVMKYWDSKLTKVKQGMKLKLRIHFKHNLNLKNLR